MKQLEITIEPASGDVEHPIYEFQDTH